MAGYLGAGLGGASDTAAVDAGAASTTSGRHLQLTFRDGAEAFPSISSDGEWFVYASRADGDWDVYLQAVGGENAINLTEDSPVDDWMPAMSPDGTRLAVATEAIAGSPYKRFGLGQLLLIDVSTGATTALQVGDAVQPSFSPDGERLVYWGIGTVDKGQRDLWIVEIDGGEPIALLEDAPTGAPAPLLPGNSRWVAYPAFARDTGQPVYATMEESRLTMRVTLDESLRQIADGPRRLVSGTRNVGFPGVSPDGEWIAFGTGEGQQEDLFIQRSDGSLTRRFTKDPFKDRVPRFSPDGRTLLFYSSRSGSYDLWSINTDGSNLRSLTEGLEGDFLGAVWSSDGNRIATSRDMYSEVVILAPGPEGTAVTPVQGGGSRARPRDRSFCRCRDV